MTKLIDGKALAQLKRGQLKDAIDKVLSDGQRPPCLAVIQVGENPASSIYVRNKHKAAETAGIRSLQFHLEESVSEDELLALIEQLNQDDTVDGILCQLPLPAGIREDRVIDAIRPDKDVDGFHPKNVGLLWMGRECPLPCTAAGVVEMLKHEDISLEGKNVLVVGRSLIVGKPVAALLMAENATVTVAHSRTVDLKEKSKAADIVICAIGKHHFFDRSYFNEQAIVIDVGIHYVDGRTQGDVQFDDVFGHVAALSPVPGGVGPMTITMLLEGTYRAYLHHEGMTE